MKATFTLLASLALLLMAAGCGSEDPPESGGFDGPAVYVDAAKGQTSASGNHGSPVDTVAAAIALAKPGDTIVIAAGTYAETVDLPADVGLKGGGSGLTVIAPPADSHGINLAKGGGTVTIAGVSVTGASGYGVSAEVNVLNLVDVKVEKTKTKQGQPGTGHGVQFSNGASLMMESCNIIGNAGTGLLAYRIGEVTIIDPAFSVSPRGDGGGAALIDPAFAPASNFNGNLGGGIAIIDPAFSPSRGKTDEPGHDFSIHATLIKGNYVYGLAVFGGSGALHKSVIVGTKKRNNEDFADGITLSDGGDPKLQGSVNLGVDTVISSNERAGLLVSTPAVVTIDGEISANVHGGVWARGDKSLVKLTAESRLSQNEMVGVAVTWGARLEAVGATIEKTKLRPIAKPSGGPSVDIGDGIGVFDDSHAVVTDVTLLGNSRAGLVGHALAINAAGQVDIKVTGNKFVGGEFGIVVNKQKAGAKPASVPSAALQTDNTFEGQKTKIDPAGELAVQVSPCGAGALAEARCSPPMAGAE